MRVVCISDTHSYEQQVEVPDGDVLIHAGDLTKTGNVKDVLAFNGWLAGLPHKHKLVIAGNHDFCFEPEELRKREAEAGRNTARRLATGLEQGQVASHLLTACSYLCDSGVQIDGVKVWGSPWQPLFYNWAFNLRRGKEIAAAWEKIPTDTNVLITHGPPQGILDRTLSGHQAGCEELLLRVENLPALKLHIFGHIHEAYGETSKGGKTFVNASICSSEYQPVNKAVVVEIAAL